MKKGQRGFIQLELLCAAALLSYCAAQLLPCLQVWKSYHHKTQLQIAAGMLAEDLRSLQSQVMFHHCSSQFRLIPFSNSSGYSIAYGNPATVLLSRSFAQHHCAGVYFTNTLRLGFASSGSPSSTGTLVLSHQELQDKAMSVELQPVTGRVLVYES